MILKIIDKVKVPEVPIDAYMVEVSIMHGDADHYDTLKLGPYQDDKEIDVDLLHEIVNVLEAMGKAFPSGRGGTPEYSYRKVDGFEELLADEWPHDITCWGSEASFAGYKVYYYDESGIKYNVKVFDSPEELDK